MTTQPNKRKLDDQSNETHPPVKRHRKDESEEEDDLIPVRFHNESRQYKKQELTVIEFCKAKLQRWSPNIDIDDDDDKENDTNKQQYFIDLSVFPCITPTLFTAIIHLQQILSESDNHYKAAKSLLSDNIRINDLHQLFEICKILLVTKIFNKEIFKHYFDEHPPITYQICIQLHSIQNDPFITSIISRQVALYNIMDKYSAQSKVYDRYNKMGNRTCFPYSGNAIPNGDNAMKYAIRQIQYEEQRESLRDSYHEQIEDDCDEYQRNFYNDDIGDYDDDYMMKELEKDIDYGLCAAFDDMVQYKTNFEPFLNVFFRFINDTVCHPDYISSGNRSHFCFYGLSYIAHRISILYLQKNNAIMNYIGNNNRMRYFSNSVGQIFDLFDEILNKWGKDEVNDKMMILIKERINDCIKWKYEWNNCSHLRYRQFPESVIASINDFVSDPKWLIDNFALKCNNSDCRKVMQYILEFCTERMDETNISDSVNKTFEQYLGVRIKKQ